MPKVLKNVDSTFSRLATNILGKQMGCNIFKYIEDIVIASRNKEDHMLDLIETFANMRKAKLHLNPKKCIFCVQQGRILGYLVSQRGIEANHAKLQAILYMTPPQSA
jgi:hypothetical protein